MAGRVEKSSPLYKRMRNTQSIKRPVVLVLRILVAGMRHLLHRRRLALLIEIAFLIAVLHLTYRALERVWSNPSETVGYPRVPTSLERSHRSP